MSLRVGICLAGLCSIILLRSDAPMAAEHHRPVTTAGSAPATLLWAWEEPEDLRGIDPQRVGVAFLAERIFLGSQVRLVPRRQRILTPEAAYVVAVARIETTREFLDSNSLRRETASSVLRAASLPNVRGVQVDFDATESQREFYADVLRRVRAGLPHDVGLTMTALVSWCAAPNRWLSGLPVDAAIPMYFRLGKHTGRWEIREPLCGGNAGISIDEPRGIPALRDSTRVYLFAPRPWTEEQLAVLNREGLPSLSKGGQ